MALLFCPIFSNISKFSPYLVEKFTFEPLAFSHTNYVHNLVRIKDIFHRYSLLHVFPGPVHLRVCVCERERKTHTVILKSQLFSPPNCNLFSNGASVDLNLHDVRLLLIQTLDETQLHTTNTQTSNLNSTPSTEAR